MTKATLIQIAVAIACVLLGEAASAIVAHFRRVQQVVKDRAQETGFQSAVYLEASCPYRAGSEEAYAWQSGRCAGLAYRVRGWNPPVDQRRLEA